MAEGRTSRLRVLVAFGIAVALVLLLALVWPAAVEPPASAPAPEEEGGRTPAAQPVAAAPPGPRAPGGPPEDPISAYREQTRYPPTSGRLRSTAVDLLEPNRRYETLRPIEATLGRGPAGRVEYRIDADRYYYTGDEVVRAILRVRRGDEVLPVVIRRAVAVAESASGPVGDPERLRFRLENGEPTAALDLETAFPEHHGTIQLSVDFEWEPGATEEATLRIFSTPVGGIPAVFTGRDDDHLEGGSLVVDAGIEILRAGFYRIDANLFTQAGEPLAYAAFKGDLPAGTRTVPLEFFGLLLRDLGVPGPYEVRNLRGYLFREAEHPDRLRMRDATHTHWTRSYDLASFSEEEFTSEHKTRMLGLLEADQAAGLAVEHPAKVGSSEPGDAALVDDLE